MAKQDNNNINTEQLSWLSHMCIINILLGKRLTSALEPWGPSSRSLSQFLKHSVTWSIATPSWMEVSFIWLPANVMSDFLDSLTVSLFTQGEGKYQEKDVFKNAAQWSSHTSYPTWPLDLQFSALTVGPTSSKSQIKTEL